MKLTLQWVAETPFSDYVAKIKLMEEVWSRVNRRVYFVSDFRVIIGLPESETAQYTQTSRKRTIITTTVLCGVLLIFVIFFIAEKFLIQKHNIKMDFCDVGSVLGMWNSEVSGEGTCAVFNTSVTIGLTQDGDISPQHIGTLQMIGNSTRGARLEQHVSKLDTFETSKRDPKRPLA